RRSRAPTNRLDRDGRSRVSASARSDPPAEEDRIAPPLVWQGQERDRERLRTSSLSLHSSLSSSLLDAVRNRHDDVDLADFGHLRLDVTNDGAIPTLDDSAGVQRFDLEERVIPILIIGVDELGRVRALLHDDALGKIA